MVPHLNFNCLTFTRILCNMLRLMQKNLIHSFIDATCQNARTYIIYSNVNELYVGSEGFCRPKCHFSLSKSANFVKNVATNLEFCQFTMHYSSLLTSFIKFRQISSKINIFVTTASFRHFVRSVFRQKRNPLDSGA